MDNYQTFIHRSRYARWMPELGRRETWGETVDRYIGFFVKPHERRDSHERGNGATATLQRLDGSDARNDEPAVARKGA